jgi:hypothetical protein
MAKETKKLDELFHDTLKDIYFAEKKILATLPKMAKAAQNEELRAAFEKHEAETEDQVGRLEQIFAAIDKKPQGKTCAAIVGITDEGAEIMKEYKGSPALDAGLLAAPRPSSTMKSPATAPLTRGRRSLASGRHPALAGRADRYRQNPHQSAGGGRLTPKCPAPTGHFCCQLWGRICSSTSTAGWEPRHHGYAGGQAGSRHPISRIALLLRLQAGSRADPNGWESRYGSGRSPDWLKFKNPAAPAVKR